MKKGFTLVEVLLFTALIPLVFIAFSAMTTVSIHREQNNEHKILASHYGEELREWLRGQKEIDWNSFTTTYMGTWCFNTEPVSSWPGSNGACGSYGLQNIYKREAVLSVNADATQVTSTITTKWFEGQNTFSIVQKTILSVYE